MLYVVYRSYVIYVTCVVIFVSRAVCHMLAYTAYMHVHTTHMCNPVIEFRLMYIEWIEMVINFLNFVHLFVIMLSICLSYCLT